MHMLCDVGRSRKYVESPLLVHTHTESPLSLSFTHSPSVSQVTVVRSCLQARRGYKRAKRVLFDIEWFHFAFTKTLSC